MRNASSPSRDFACGVGIDADDSACTCQPCALDSVHTDTAETEHHHAGTSFNLGRIQRCAQTGCASATETADHIQWCVRIYTG
ncbi:hypothetical protein D9M68_773220 [compost metagenome]